MDDTGQVAGRLSEAVEAGDWERVEELWLEALDADPIPIDDLLEARRAAWKAGRKTLARTLLELLAEALEGRGDHAGALTALSELIRLTDKPGAGLAERLENALRGARAGSPSLEAVLERHPLRSARRPLEVLAVVERWLDYDVGTVVEVRGQGVGRITDANLDLDTFKVEVGNARPVSVPFGAADKYLRRLREGGFLYRKVTDPEALRELVAAHPGEALVELLEDLEGPADVAAIKAAMEGILPPARWTAWWAKARKHPRVLVSGSGSRLRYQVSSSADEAAESLVEALRNAAPRRRLDLVRRLTARGDAWARRAAAILETSLGELEGVDPGTAWETALALAGLPGGSAAAEECLRRLVREVQPVRLLSGIEDRAARLRALEAVRETRPDDWAEAWSEWFLEEEHPAVLDRIAAALEESGHSDRLEDVLEAVFRNPRRHAARFIWACEAMTDDDAPGILRQRMTPSVLELLPDTLTRKDFARFRARAKSLLDGGRAAIRIMLERATPEQAQRFAERMTRISGLEDRRLRLVQQAAAQRRSAGAAREEAPAFVATRSAIEARQAELKRLLEVEIPKTLEGIQAAAAEGDLRENFEYHMLRDRQELLSARAAKLQEDLARVQVLEPGAADTSRVNIGTVVRLEDPEGRPLEPVTIVGQWDADVDRRRFANGTEIAQELLGRRVGEEVTVEGRSARIAAIEPWDGAA